MRSDKLNADRPTPVRFSHASPGWHPCLFDLLTVVVKKTNIVLMALLTRYGESASVLPISNMEALPLAEPTRTGLPDSLGHAVRIWPHLYDTEGAFVARLGKQATTQWSQVEPTRHSGSPALRTIPLRWKPVRP